LRKQLSPIQFINVHLHQNSDVEFSSRNREPIENQSRRRISSFHRPIGAWREGESKENKYPVFRLRTQQETAQIMSTMKPDYFIAHNGLPNILLERSRHLITNTIKSQCDRVSSNQQQIHPPSEHNRLGGVNQQAHVMQCDSDNNIRNRAIKENLRNVKSTKDLINAQIVRSAGWCRRNQQTHKCANADKSGNRADRRCTKVTAMDYRDNKLNQQRKYDNTIFRQDLPDRLILPPLPV